jgi:hypothetical protein
VRGLQRSEDRRRCRCLRTSELVEWRVELTLEESVGVPRCPAVPPEDEPARGQDSPEAAGRSSPAMGMTGQSFHSRSSA